MRNNEGRVVTSVIHREVTPKAEVAIAGAIGILTAALLALFSTPLGAALIGWDVAAFAYLVWVWATTRGADPDETRRRATKFDLQDARVRDLILLSAAVASLAADGFVLARAGRAHGADVVLQPTIALLSITLSWAVLHTVYMLRYADLYYQSPTPPIDFNTDVAPTFGDFVYLAFTIGMTYQVSDTPLNCRSMRRTAFRHALLSFAFGTGILAVAINLVASISSNAPSH